MRVTTTQMYNTLLSGIRQQQDIQSQGNAQISSGTKFQTPAEAGLAYKTSLDIRHAQTGLKGDLTSVSTAESRLSSSMTMLNDMTNVMKRAQTLAVQMGTSSAGPTERLSASQESTQLLNQLVNDANQQWQGQSLFAGTATDKPAFITNAFNPGTGLYTAGTNTSISAVTQQLNPGAVNDSYAITLDAAGTSIASITNAQGTNLLTAPFALTAGANTIPMSNGVELGITYSGTPDTVNLSAGTLAVSGATQQGSISYNGNAQDRAVVTSDGQQITSNIRGDNPAFAAAFSALQGLTTALKNNDMAGVQSALGALTSAGDGIVNMTSDVGARLTGVRLNKAAIEDRQLNLTKQLNTHEAVDIPSVVARMQQSSIALQAAYSQINQIKSLSLTNFLR